MKYDFIEIGTSDFDTEIEKSTHDTKGISIEPIEHYLNKLPDKNNVIKVNKAISLEDGISKIYYFSPENIIKYNLPWWFKGCNKINEPHYLHLDYINNHSIPWNTLEYIEIKSMTIESLLNLYDVEKLDFLKMNLEGYGCHIVLDYLNYTKKNPNVKAKKIMFESNRWTNQTIVEKAIIEARAQGYNVIKDDYNTIFEIEEMREIENENIPNIMHFIWFSDAPFEFDLHKYITIKSALDVNEPDKLFYYCNHEPFGYYWDKLKDKIIIEITNPPEEIFGIPIQTIQHKSDVIRLQKLIERGGIYMDMDTICINSFSNLLKNNDTVLGENVNGMICNAVMLSRPNASFMLKWYDTYRGFDNKWATHSCIVPLHVRREIPDTVTSLTENSFFYPLWDIIGPELTNILDDEHMGLKLEEYNKLYCIHFWSAMKIPEYNEIKNYTIEDIRTKNNIYCILARKYILDL